MKSYNWKKGIVFFAGCGLIGAVLGGVLKSLEGSGAIHVFAQQVQSMAPSMFVIAFIVGLIGLGGYFYFNAQLKKEQYSDEEGSFYEKHEKAMSIVMMCSTLCAIFNFTALGVNIFNTTALANLFFPLVFANVVVAFFGEVAHISLVKKVRPELDADPLKTSFTRDYFDQLDEYEKNKTGKACFKTLTAMVPLYVSLFLACYVLSIFFNVSAVICLPIGIMWGAQTILMTYYGNKKDK
ncbi:MAG: DUF3169 family protein [Cellulosilyticaceae bacterium]